MAASDAATLEAYKAARDALLVKLQAGTLTVEYQIGSLRKRDVPITEALADIEEQIAKYERRSTPRFRLAKPQRATN